MKLSEIVIKNFRLLQDVRRDTWGFDGFAVSDAQAVHNLLTHGFAADLTSVKRDGSPHEYSSAPSVSTTATCAICVFSTTSPR